MITVAEIDAALAPLLALRARLASEPAAPPTVYVDQDDADTLSRYRISRRAYLEAGRRGDLRTDRIGRQVRTTIAELESWLASRRRTPQPRLELIPSGDAARQALEGAAARFARKAGRS